MKNNNVLTKIKIITMLSIISIMLTLSLSFGFINSDHVYAEEIEQNRILNFNQNIANDKISFTYPDRDSTPVTPSMSITSRHYFYLKFTKNIVNTNTFGYRDSTNHDIIIITTGGFYDTYFSIDTSINYFYIYSVGSGLTISDFNLFDLTKMYGVGNEPSYEECKSIFSGVYSYSSGTPVSYNQLDYIRGYKDGINSADKFTNSEIIFNNNINNIINNQTGLNTVLNADGSFTYSNSNGFVELSLDKPLTNKVSYIIKCDYINSNGSGDLTLELVLSDGSYQQFDILNNKIDLQFYYIDKTFSSVTISQSNMTSITIKNLVIYSFNDVVSAYDDGYNTGYYDGIASVDTDAYFQSGLREGINRSETNIFKDGFEFLGTMFHGMGDILSIEFIPNVPMWSFFMIPLTLGIISLVYKLVGKD